MLKVQGLARDFGGRQVFTSDSLEAGPAGLVALRGSNGSGKTTLLRILATLTSPSAGDAWIGGHSVVSSPRRARERLGFVPAGEGGMYRRLTGRENLMLFAGLCGLSAGESRRAIDRLREELPLDGALECRFGLASSGMRQRMVLCRALLHDPDVLLLDEPARSLDPESRDAFRKVLGGLATRKLILFSSHDESEWREATAVWRIQEGVLRCSASS